MRFIFLALLLTSTPFAAAQEAAGEERPGLVFRTDAPVGYTNAPASSHAEPQAPPLAVVSLGAAIGYGLGTGGGYGVGLATERSFVPEHILSDHGIVGAWIGGSAVSALGAHLANGRRGTLWMNILATVAAQGLYAAFAQGLGAPVLLVGTPMVGVATSVAIERLSAR